MNIVIIGAGNVATHLSIALTKAGLKPVQILSKTENNAAKLAFLINSQYTTNPDELKNADLYILAVSDSAIKEIIEHQKLKNKFLVHTAGSVPMSVFRKVTPKYGVLYPLQTLKKSYEVDFTKVPLCIEACDDDSLLILKQIAYKISDNVNFIDSEQRAKLHLSAVFVNNFVNHLFAIANDIVEKSGVDKKILLPLIEQTFINVQKNNPAHIQTGPANRNDFSTIDKHLELLKQFPNIYSDLYKIISKSIQEFK